MTFRTPWTQPHSYKERKVSHRPADQIYAVVMIKLCNCSVLAPGGGGGGGGEGVGGGGGAVGNDNQQRFRCRLSYALTTVGNTVR